MSLFFCICVLFCFGAILGWILELFFRRFVSSKKWINPGFLTGPYLPIYGFGVVTLFLLSYSLNFKEWFTMPIWLNDILIILILGISMTLIELIAGLIFIKGMKIKLWDYSDRKFNYKGIICPTFFLIWTLVGALFYYLLKNPCIELLNWFAKSSLTDAHVPFILGLFYGVFIVDLCQSLNITVKIRKFAKDHKIIVNYERFKDNIRDVELKAKNKINYIFPFKSITSFKEQLEHYIEKIKEDRKK